MLSGWNQFSETNIFTLKDITILIHLTNWSTSFKPPTDNIGTFKNDHWRIQTHKRVTDKLDSRVSSAFPVNMDVQKLLHLSSAIM
jgi:hypothetical protein